MKSRAQLEAEAIAKYRKMAKKWGITEEQAEKKARKLLPSNSDKDLREFLRKPMKGLSINALDPAHAAADRKLQRIAQEINQTYNRAAAEMQQKITDYLEKFKEADERMLEHLKNGEITKQQYKQWREQKMLQTKQWEQMRDNLAADASNANDIARSVIQGHMPDVYAENYNFGVYEIENGLHIDTSFTLYDRQTVEHLFRDNPKLLPDPAAGSETAKRIAKSKDLAWNRDQIQGELLQGILQGESIPAIAKRVRNVTTANRKASMRYARTMITGAQNAGRVDSYKRAKDMGIVLEQTWMATLDGRTRDSHRLLDGEHIQIGGTFSNGCRYPGDPEGTPRETYNCRCTLIARIRGYENDLSDTSWRKDDKLDGMTYEQWKQGKKKR